MDRISGLPDDVLVKILSFVPTKVAVSTSSLSKRWEFLWMWLTKLEFGDILYSESEFKSLQCFLNRNLPLHRAPVIERFCLDLGLSDLIPEDIRMWAVVAVSRHIREFKMLVCCHPYKRSILPSSLYTSKSLVILVLVGGILLDVPRMVCLPSLKTLKLISSRYSKEGSLQRLLSNCPVLERPKCLLSSLQNFTWSGYLGRPQDRDIAVYILKNACRLRTAEFVADTHLVPKLEMITELTRSSRASSTCELLFR
ncbi:PREDICTED: LOW QUALITY PROTEIN: FBD-associated F-box protein At4g10400-like [Camelina sativa]|uniref:LOW QUALITY PROTEIN: FBD-associated F-box protein At4g10400-like n=1 Tax=Camelina sativa TaxID=90675 RepID=A0ABM0U7I5_CAMSA|nr:PREDICTED: LOW QUALITY PROTEIN: FBD-associated F-box protein At4g10400-like [Camelina sativa]